MDDLIAFLRAQLDEDERMARAADRSRWFPEDKGITFEFYADEFPNGEAQARLVADTRANQYHIARHDPARVLAEVAAKRALLDLHRPWFSERAAPLTHKCQQCGEISEAPVRWPCPTLHILAQPYAGAPGWREEWRVADRTAPQAE